MIRVRDDDVFLLGRDAFFTPDQCVERFKEVHKIIVDGGAMHVAGVICGTLHHFPGGVEFMKERMQEGELLPEIHGWEHVNYGELSKTRIVEHLNRSIGVIQDSFDYDPKIWYTPWGGNDSVMMEASERVGLQMVDCSKILYPKRRYFGSVQWRDHCADVRAGQELLIHWWQDRWFEAESHNLVKVLQTIKEDRLIFAPC